MINPSQPFTVGGKAGRSRGRTERSRARCGTAEHLCAAEPPARCEAPRRRMQRPVLHAPGTSRQRAQQLFVVAQELCSVFVQSFAGGGDDDDDPPQTCILYHLEYCSVDR